MQISKITGDTIEKTKGAIATLIEQGRVLEVDQGEFGSEVWEITNYDVYHRGEHYNKRTAMKIFAGEHGKIGVEERSEKPDNLIFLTNNT